MPSSPNKGGVAGNGTADVALTFTAELSPEERQAISFDTAEYEAAKWVDPATIIQDASFHTALRRCTTSIPDFVQVLVDAKIRNPSGWSHF